MTSVTPERKVRGPERKVCLAPSALEHDSLAGSAMVHGLLDASRIQIPFSLCRQYAVNGRQPGLQDHAGCRNARLHDMAQYPVPSRIMPANDRVITDRR
jgi:hypothetical protein